MLPDKHHVSKTQWRGRENDDIIHQESHEVSKGRRQLALGILVSSGRQRLSMSGLAGVHGQALKIANPGFIIRKTIGISAEVVGIVGRRSSMRGRETSRKTLVLRGCGKSTKGVHWNEATGRDSNIARSSGEG